jgi:hypothetical protein
MITRLSMLTLAMGVGLAAGGCTTAQTIPGTAAGEVAIVRPGALELRQDMRKLWSDHVIWTRQYIVSAVGGDASASAAATRLMKNQEDIGNAIAPYYGAAAGTKLTGLLKDHITIAVDLVAAAKAGDNAKVADADKRWHANASDIAAFLAGANPNWSRDALQTMLNEHLSLTTQEAQARIQKRWTDDTSLFDRIFDQALMMADALTDGIVKQFPAKV